MPGVATNSGDLSLVPYSPELPQPIVHTLHHGLNTPIARLSISCCRDNTLRVSVLRPPSDEVTGGDDDAGGRVLEVKLSNSDGENSEATRRKIAYGSVAPFALLQSRRSSVSNLSKMSLSPSPYSIDWWEYVMEYSKDINSLLGDLNYGD